MKKSVRLYVFFLLIGNIIVGKAAPLSKAQWIWHPNVNQSNCWMRFRKQVVLDKIPAKVLATIAVDSKYWLWINGQLVIREGGLKRTPNPHDTYADTVNLKPYFVKGKNTIAILVWYWGKEGHGHNSSGHGGLYFDAPAGTKSIISDSSWQVSVHPAFYTLRTGPQPYRPLAEFNIDFDAQKDEVGWYSALYNDQLWLKAAMLGSSPSSPGGN